ncbi:MAG: carboxypeptidase-like regulatory domain-containing protein [Bacteroidota bacterium]
MKKIVTLLVLCAGAFVPAIAQSGLILDAESEQAISGATVYAVNSGIGTISGEDGTFSLTLEQFPDTLVISYLGYQQEIIPVSRAESYWQILLQPTSATLPEIIVNAYRQPAQLSPLSRTITDFLIIDEQLVLLLYQNQTPHYHLCLADLQGDIFYHQPLGNRKPEQLYQGCLGGYYLVYENYLQAFERMQDTIRFIEKYPKATFKNILAPCVHANEEYVYTGYRRTAKQVFELFTSLRATGESTHLHTIVNERALAQLADEQRFRDDKARTIVETDPVRRTRTKRMYSDEQQFAEHVVYRPIHVQVFPYSDWLLLFEYTNDQISWLDQEGNTTRSIPIVFHQKDPWKAKVLHDEVRQKFYVLHEDNRYSYLSEIDPRTGQLQEKAVIPEIYIQQAQVRNGRFFYLHKGVTFEDRWRYLYRVDLE